MRFRTGAASVALAGLLAVGAAVPAQAAGQATATGNGANSYSGTAARAGSGVGAFQTGGDLVHFSHTVEKTVNAHGWWKRINGPAKKAKVKVWLQVKSGGSWRTVNTGEKTVYSGGGSGKRASAAWHCTNLIAKNTFRSIVDVDLIGYPDDANQKVTTPQTLYCGV